MFGRDLIAMTWEDVAFLHWPVDPATVADRLPKQLDVATFNGDAYLGVVPFRMREIRLRGVPFGLSFVELNLRTYVDGPQGRGVYFYSLDADDPIGVAIARILFTLPYYRATGSIRHERTGSTPDDALTAVHIRSQRTATHSDPVQFDATIQPTDPDREPSQPDPGTREAFLVENYRFYATAGTDALLPSGLYCGHIDHDPWPIREATAEIRANTIFSANGFTYPDGAPIAHYCRSIPVTAGRVHRVASDPS